MALSFQLMADIWLHRKTLFEPIVKRVLGMNLPTKIQAQKAVAFSSGEQEKKLVNLISMISLERIMRLVLLICGGFMVLQSEQYSPCLI